MRNGNSGRGGANDSSKKRRQHAGGIMTLQDLLDVLRRDGTYREGFLLMLRATVRCLAAYFGKPPDKIMIERQRQVSDGFSAYLKARGYCVASVETNVRLARMLYAQAARRGFIALLN